MILSRPPDINLPLSAERSPPPQLWNPNPFDILHVGLGPQINETDTLLSVSKSGRKCAKRLDSVWGAWFFFSYYFKPVLNEKSKGKVVRDSNGVLGFDKSDLELEVFLVQYDMENMYMWVFKDRPENALGKMQLRSYMNGHSHQGERPFSLSVDKGFVRSHRMQRKHYRGLSNPQCVHGIEFISLPNLKGLDEEEQKRWIELTGRDLNFSVPREASEFCSWRNLPNTEFELNRPLHAVKTIPHPHPKKLLNGSGLNLSTRPLSHTNGGVMDLSHACNKRKKDLFPHGNDEDCCLVINQHNDRVQDTEMHPVEPPWVNEFSGVIITLPFADLKRVEVTWWNTLTHGVVKVSSVSNNLHAIYEEK